MISKKTMILECIIVEYINNPIPIGSEQLKSSFGMGFSSSTIRNYFKQLVDEGCLTQLHTSGGRVPTQEALTKFWSDRLLPQEKVTVSSLERLDKASREFGIPAIAKVTKKNRLRDVLAMKDRYIVAEFEKGEALLRYSEPLQHFLEGLIGHDIRDIYSVAERLGISELIFKIAEMLKNEKTHVFAEESLLSIDHSSIWINQFLMDIVARGRLEEVDTGIYFDRLVPQGCVAVKKEASIDDEEAWVFVVGKLSSNFLGYFNSLH